MTVSNERLDEMLARLEGLPVSPWLRWDDGPGHDLCIADGRGYNANVAFWRGGGRVASLGIIANHIERCDPDTMRSILTELRDRRASPSGVEVKGLQDDAPLSRPVPEQSDLPTWLHVNNLFTQNGVDVPPSRLRDEIVTLMAWAWHGVKLHDALSCLTPPSPTGEAEPVAGKCICNMPPGFHADACPARARPVHNGVAVSEEMVERPIDWGDDTFLKNLERRTDRDPTKYTAMLTVAEANQAASHIRKLRSEVEALMNEREIQRRTLERIAVANPDDDDMYEIAGIAQAALEGGSQT